MITRSKAISATALLALAVAQAPRDAHAARAGIPLREHIGSSVVERLRDPVLARARSLAPELRRVLDTIRDSRKNPESPEQGEQELLAGFYYVAAKDSVSSRAASAELPGAERARRLEKELARRLDLLRGELRGLDPATREFEERLEAAAPRIFESWDAEAMRFSSKALRAEESATVTPALRQARERHFDSFVIELPRVRGPLAEEMFDIFGASGFRAFPHSYVVLRDIFNQRHSFQGRDAGRALDAYFRHLSHQTASILPRAIEIIERAEAGWWYPGKGRKVRLARQQLADAYASLNGILLGGGEVDRLLTESGLSEANAKLIEDAHVATSRALAELGHRIRAP